MRPPCVNLTRDTYPPMTMNAFDFTLKIPLPESEVDQEAVAARLYANGCDDALIGIGRPGFVVLDFTRVAPSLREAMESALRDVARVIPSVGHLTKA
jgi:hypothetical protein